VGHPNGNIKEATAGKRKVRIVSIEGLDDLIKAAPYYSVTEIPMDQYPDAVNGKEKVKTLGMLATLVTSEDTPKDVVYAITKEVMENLAEFKKLHPALSGLTKESMLQGLTAPIHEGALKYYKEAGLIK
jgi:TRAP transporter TAXI family solute receptor